MSSTAIPVIPGLVLCLACLLSVSSAMPPKCGPGSFFNGEKCKLCPPGTYQQKERATDCIPCPPGTYNPFRGAQGLDICIECEKGTFNNKAGATSKSDCNKCPDNTTSVKGLSTCIFCPAGTRISTCRRRPSDFFKTRYRGQCISCDAGNVGTFCSRVGPLKPECLECRAGSFSNTTNSFKCQPCPKGTTSKKGATGCTPGSQCPPGASTVSGCSKCTSFSYSDGTFKFCEECPPGFIGNAREGADRCVLCPPGTAKGGSFGQCRPCKPGENSSTKGAMICVPDDTPCPSNHFRNTNGTCSTCSRRQRFDESKNECVTCPKNALTEGGVDTKCRSCPLGKVVGSVFGSLQCVCRPGSGFGDGEGRLGGGCKVCPPGTESSGDSYCTPCFIDSFAPRSGTSQCESCPPGTLQPLFGQSKCRQIDGPRCEKGLIKNEDGFCINPATNCPPNHRRIGTGDVEEPLCSVLSCPPGLGLVQVFDNTPDKRCGVCSKSQRYNPKQQLCVFCGDKSFSEGGLSQTCEKCPDGQEFLGGKCRCVNASRIVDGKCVRCPPRTFGFNSVPGCELCPAGTFSEGRGSFESCQTCKAGTSSGIGAKKCKPCPEGTTTFGFGDATCVRVGSLG